MNTIKICVNWTSSKPEVTIDEIRDATVKILDFAPQLEFRSIDIKIEKASSQFDLPEMFCTTLEVACLCEGAVAKQEFEDAYGETSQHSIHPVNILNLRTRGTITAVKVLEE